METQGSSSVTESPLHAFPTTEVADNAPKYIIPMPPRDPSLITYTRPSLARLAPVDELEQSTVTTGGLEAAPLSTQRIRHESTASSRFFPGGWFSGSPKSPNDNRTSLDHATGEFSRVEPLSASPGQDVPVNTPVDGEPVRRRWCLIM